MGIVAMAAGVPALGLAAGALAVAAGVLGWRNGATSSAGSETGSGSSASGETDTETPSVAELAAELGLARLREQALHQRIELLQARPEGGSSRHTGVVSGVGESSDLLTDASTGLFSEAYFEVALETRIAAARRRLRPVALVLIDVVRDLSLGDPRQAEPPVVTAALRSTLREADTACRLDDGRYALVLEDTPENGAIWTVERVRSHLGETGAAYTVWAGVACYPAHAFDKDAILSQALDALAQAREWHQDRIEVATPE